MADAGIQNAFLQDAGVEVPLICGPMYPCSNPELVAAVSEAGGLGVVQPISLTYVYGHDFREGLRMIKRLTRKPFGMNALIEKSSRRYHERMQRWVDIAIEEGVRFFITSLGKPGWVVQRAHAVGGVVYHDATERKWADKALSEGVDGLIAVNNRAGGHTGGHSAQSLYRLLEDTGVPLICAGGVGNENDFIQALNTGYAAVQLGTRFIATEECQTNLPYKQAIVNSTGNDIVLTERLSGAPVSVINTAYIKEQGYKVGPVTGWMLRHPKAKYLARTLLALKSFWQLKSAVLDPEGKQEFWQAGKSVDHIHSIEPAGDIVHRFAASLKD